ncbi:MAG: PSD1 and planctomycete cytochrome C domain-containing protein [Bryobacteraceae bacterium]
MRWILYCVALVASAQDYATEVRPLLQKRCFGCHGDATRTSGLSLQSMESIRTGGNRGPATERILAAIQQSGDLKMPPSGKLPANEIAILERWIKNGFPGLPEAGPAAQKPSHWSFVRPRRSPGNIDRFITDALAKNGLTPAPEADKTTLLRRVHLDLTGLPPSPQEVDDFLNDQSPSAYERRVDALLNSPHYGERWARHWLDEVRYADSDGGSRDELRQIWKYREYVINALNADKPFNQFVIEQLAGDLLPNATPEQRIATGMQRNSLLQIEAGTDRELYRTEAVADRVDMFGAVFLGLSTGCARCHDHKFDPISQREYYQLFSFFNNVNEYSNDLPPYADTLDLEITHQPLLALGPAEEVRKYETLRSMILALQKERSAYINGREINKATDPALKLRNDAIDALKKQVPKLPLVMVMQELPAPRPAFIMLGGDYQRRGAPVRADVLSAINAKPDARPGSPRKTRLDLANWLVDPENPLLARVTVNRIWQRYFGRGIVETENDFGRMGSKPTHPELLDWLAIEFIENGWSRKAVHRAIVLSRTYRQSSNVRPESEKKDPRNLLLSRQNRLRLEAEIIRDSALTVSGLLHPAIGGPSVFPPQPDGAMDASQVKKTWKTSQGPDRYRRGLYTHSWRITPHPAMNVFDAPSAMMSCTRRTRSNTPLQALTLLNGEAFHEMAQALAKRIVAEGGETPESRLEYGFRLTHSRRPSATEAARLRALLNAEKDDLATHPEDAAKLAADPALAPWTALARVLINTDEFITRE